METRRKPEHVVPFLHKCLEDAKTRTREGSGIVSDYVSDEQPGSMVSPVRLFNTIQTMLRTKENLAPQLKAWEKELMNNFNNVVHEIDDDVFDKTKFDSINEKLESIYESIEQFMDMICQPISGEIPAQPQQQAPLAEQGRKVSEDWSGLKVEQAILRSQAMETLQVGFEILDSVSRLCLYCLAIFPEMSEIKKKPLIYWWIAEGFIVGSAKSTAEEEGEAIFEELISKGFILPVRRNEKSHLVKGCRLHPWFHRMLISVCQKGNFFDFDDLGNATSNFSKSHRACLVSGGAELSSHTAKLEDLLVLCNLNEQYLNLSTDLVSELKKVEVLQLGRWQYSAAHHIEVENEDFLKELGTQKYLKYLSFRGVSRITELPASLAQLKNVEILDLRACHNLEKIPFDIGLMSRLTHLDISECYLLESIPDGLQKLSSLEVLKGFVIRNWGRFCTLSDLAQLRELRKLSISIWQTDTVGEVAELSKLMAFERLRILTITWGVMAKSSQKEGVQSSAPTQSNARWNTIVQKASAQRHMPVVDTVKMSSFSFPPNLEKLDLRCFPHQRMPNQLKPSTLKGLKKLYITGGNLESLDTEENEKWNVKYLRLKFLKNLKIEQSRLRELFPNLIDLELTTSEASTS